MKPTEFDSLVTIALQKIVAAPRNAPTEAQQVIATGIEGGIPTSDLLGAATRLVGAQGVNPRDVSQQMLMAEGVVPETKLQRGLFELYMKNLAAMTPGLQGVSLLPVKI
jgi:hypothetical protein